MLWVIGIETTTPANLGGRQILFLVKQPKGYRACWRRRETTRVSLSLKDGYLRAVADARCLSSSGLAGLSIVQLP